MQIEEQPERPVLFIRAALCRGEVGEVLGSVLPRVFQHVQSAGVLPTMPPFAHYLSWDADGNGELAGGVGVPEGTEGDGDLEVGVLPAGPAAVVWHHGSYDGLRDEWQALCSEIAESAEWEAAGPGWEIYWDDPVHTALPTLRTQIVMPVRPRPADQ